ncbi:lytic murein transglycosylase [Thiomicrospira microaerophila]|uniref:lytic murein transglycosylase n=1 Tax=Thiomicrospira microaerophila TaxID=406020 RepID=UPI00201047CD|nr:lytic murein transglycosylase [Thiomicrospira microaerophila]UQB41521.1 lytic murein transglycosylase [Thiomicrospira microaerophila]
MSALFSLVLLVGFSAQASQKAPTVILTEADHQAFQAWVEDFKPKARAEGISQATLDKAFSGVKLNQRVLELDRHQPEFTRTFWQYLESAVSDWRIQRGKEMYAAHRELLDEVTKQYGIPGRFLVAFWGLETNYGNFTGSFPVIESLATLSYDPRRSAFFTKQLIYALRILDQGHIPFEQMKGSWAGAMGQTQFMPENYLRYTIDADGTGRKDMWNSLEDVFHSSGNFLKNLGWQAEQTWGREVTLPKNFDFALADGRTQRSLAEWQQLGIRQTDGSNLPTADFNAALLIPSDYRGPAFLVYHNFNVIKRWNMSNNYAVAVGHLADRIIDAPPLSAKKPADDAALSRAQIIEMQQRLNQLGYDVGGADGIPGARTRNGIRAFQIANNIPADGAPTMNILNRLQQTAH